MTWMEGIQYVDRKCFSALAKHYFANNQVDLAMAYLEQGASTGCTNLMCQLGTLLQQNGDKEGAMMQFTQAAFNGNAEAMIKLLTQYISQGDETSIAALAPFVISKRSPLITILVKILRGVLQRLDPESCSTIDRCLEANLYPAVPPSIASRSDIQVLVAAMEPETEMVEPEDDTPVSEPEPKMDAPEPVTVGSSFSTSEREH